MTEISKRSLSADLDRAAIRYARIRLEYFVNQSKGSLVEIEETRTRSHDGLIACFSAFLRASEEKPADMVSASVNRVEIGKWALRRALQLLTQGA